MLLATVAIALALEGGALVPVFHPGEPPHTWCVNGRHRYHHPASEVT